MGPAAGTTPAGPIAPAGGRPLRRDAELNRQRILQAAREVFAARGLEVNLDDIARHAGLGVGTVYRRFATREILVDALFEERIEELVALADQALADPDPWHGFAGFLERACALQAADRGLHEIVHGATYGQQRVAVARARLGPLVGRLLRRAQDAGRVRADVTANDVAMLGLMVGSAATYTRHIDPDVWRRYLTILLDGLRGPGHAPAPLPTAALDEGQLTAAMRCWRPSRQQ